MNPRTASLFLFVALAGCVAVGEADRNAYRQLTNERLQNLDEKIRRWSEARSRQDIVLESVLRRDLRRESARMADALKLGLGSNDPAKRTTCAGALGFSEDESAVALLAELQKDSDDAVRSSAMLALCLIGSERTPLEPVLGGLRDHDPLVRSLAVLCLAHLYDPARRADLFDFFVSALQDADPKVRINASSVLARLGETRASPFLASFALKDEVGMVRRNAAIGLGRLKVPETAAPLVDALEREMSSTVKKEIVFALEKITGKNPGDDPVSWREVLDNPPVTRTGQETPAKEKPTKRNGGPKKTQ